jgi:hypothetical protein
VKKNFAARAFRVVRAREAMQLRAHARCWRVEKIFMEMRARCALLLLTAIQ